MRPIRETWCLLIALMGLLVPAEAHAQREGLIIDIGVGLGWVSGTYSTVGLGESNRESKLGLALDLNIGAALRPDLDVYFASQSTLRGTGRQGTDRAISGMAGVGATYHVNETWGLTGALGVGFEALYMDGFLGSPFDTSVGPGGLVGVLYGVGEDLALNVDLAFATWDDGEIFGSEEVRSWRVGLTLVYLGG